MGRKDWARRGANSEYARREIYTRHASLWPTGTPISCSPSGGKITYPSYDAAFSAATELEPLTGVMLRSYRCREPPLHHWHLTSGLT